MQSQAVGITVGSLSGHLMYISYYLGARVCSTRQIRLPCRAHAPHITAVDMALENVLYIYNRTSRGTWVRILTSQIVFVIDRPHRCGLRCARATRHGWHELAGPRPTQRDDIGVIFARLFATSARSARPRTSASTSGSPSRCTRRRPTTSGCTRTTASAGIVAGCF